jgi:hypothetical protein
MIRLDLLFLSSLVLVGCGGPLNDEFESVTTETGIDGDGDGDGHGDGDGDDVGDGDGDPDGDPTDGWPDPGDTGEQPQEEAHGMTWVVEGNDPELRIVLVGADDFTDAYVGDTLCTEVLPMLCLDEDEWFDNPGIVADFYHGWTGRRVALTGPIVGTDLTSLEAANLICAEQFGPTWRIAEFHDGFGGWNWWAYADLDVLTPEVGRFWLRINDQPANCWNWAP